MATAVLPGVIRAEVPEPLVFHGALLESDHQVPDWLSLGEKSTLAKASHTQPLLELHAAAQQTPYPVADDDDPTVMWREFQPEMAQSPDESFYKLESAAMGSPMTPSRSLWLLDAEFLAMRRSEPDDFQYGSLVEIPVEVARRRESN